MDALQTKLRSRQNKAQSHSNKLWITSKRKRKRKFRVARTESKTSNPKCKRKFIVAETEFEKFKPVRTDAICKHTQLRTGTNSKRSTRTQFKADQLELPATITQNVTCAHAHSLPVEGTARADDARRLGRPRLAEARCRMKPRDRAPDSQPRARRGRLLLRPLPRRQGRRGRDEVGVDARRPRALPQLHGPLPLVVAAVVGEARWLCPCSGGRRGVLRVGEEGVLARGESRV
jgi:hypothetical protein